MAKQFPSPGDAQRASIARRRIAITASAAPCVTIPPRLPGKEGEALARA